MSIVVISGGAFGWYPLHHPIPRNKRVERGYLVGVLGTHPPRTYSNTMWICRNAEVIGEMGVHFFPRHFEWLYGYMKGKTNELMNETRAQSISTCGDALVWIARESEKLFGTPISGVPKTINVVAQKHTSQLKVILGVGTETNWIFVYGNFFLPLFEPSFSENGFYFAPKRKCMFSQPTCRTGLHGKIGVKKSCRKKVGSGVSDANGCGEDVLRVPKLYKSQLVKISSKKGKGYGVLRWCNDCNGNVS